MSLVTGELCGAEALLRWNHPRDGMRMPARFIPIAERTGIIAEVGEWVIAEVASTLGKLEAQRLFRPTLLQRQPPPGRASRFLPQASPGIRRC